MTKKIEDYLHLYPGCEVVNVIGKHMGKVVSVCIDGTSVINPINGFDPKVISTNQLKPLLRPLSDMTKEEIKEIKKIVSNIDLTGFTDGRYQYNEHEVEGKHETKIRCKVDAGIGSFPLVAVPYLLSRHFDLFFLIHEGLAITKTNSPIPQSQNS